MKAERLIKGERVQDVEYKASVPYWREPKIVNVVERGGECFYVCRDGKLYRPALFDAAFKVLVPRKPVEHYTYKGENPNYLLT